MMVTKQSSIVRKLLPPNIIDSNGEFVETYIVLDNIDSHDYFKVEITCPICLGRMTTTWTVMACLHRFCSDCFHRSLRMELGTNSQKECPLCRVKLASRRSSRPDNEFDKFLDLLSPKTTQSLLLDSQRNSNLMIISTNFHLDMKHEILDKSNQGKFISHLTSAESAIDLSKYHKAYEDSIKYFRQKQINWKNNQNRVNSSTKRQIESIDETSGTFSKKIKVTLLPNYVKDSKVLPLKKPYLALQPNFSIADLKTYLREKEVLLFLYTNTSGVTDNDLEKSNSRLQLSPNDNNIIISIRSNKEIIRIEDDIATIEEIYRCEHLKYQSNKLELLYEVQAQTMHI